MLATALVASVADPGTFRSGRNFSAWIGLVPKQHSSGGKDRLGSIEQTGSLNSAPSAWHLTFHLKRPRFWVESVPSGWYDMAAGADYRRADYQGAEAASAGLSANELCRKYGVSDATFTSGDPDMAGWRSSDARKR